VTMRRWGRPAAGGSLPDLVLCMQSDNVLDPAAGWPGCMLMYPGARGAERTRVRALRVYVDLRRVERRNPATRSKSAHGKPRVVSNVIGKSRQNQVGVEERHPIVGVRPRGASCATASASASEVNRSEPDQRSMGRPPLTAERGVSNSHRTSPLGSASRRCCLLGASGPRSSLAGLTDAASVRGAIGAAVGQATWILPRR
jgi:hypothetical protein